MKELKYNEKILTQFIFVDNSPPSGSKSKKFGSTLKDPTFPVAKLSLIAFSMTFPSSFSSTSLLVEELLVSSERPFSYVALSNSTFIFAITSLSFLYSENRRKRKLLCCLSGVKKKVSSSST